MMTGEVLSDPVPSVAVMDNNGYVIANHPEVTDVDGWLQTRISAGIRAQGWTIVSMCVQKSWSYTVGLWESYHRPEVAICGLDHDLAGAILQHFAERVRNGVEFPPDRDLGADPLILRAVHDDWRPDLFPLIGEHYGDQTAPIWQACWPDRRDRFPGQAGFDGGQPLLWLPKADHPASVWLG
jgi:hypothetical protein